jgi:hypothetical protein
MPLLRPLVLSLAAAFVAASASAGAADADWQKAYPVGARPSLAFNTGDASTEVTSCGQCREIRIRVQWNDRHPSDYLVNELQTGDHVRFELREKVRLHVMMIGNHREPHVIIETPSTIDLDARTSDGSLKLAGLQGEFQLQTSDGSVDVADVSGALRLTASDGTIQMHNVSGTLESRSSDGSVRIDGQFTGLQVHTSDGSLDLTLAEGSRLTTASRVEASDGSVVVHIPRTLAADIEVHSGDGHVRCDLPLVMNGYDSKADSGHNLRGRLNGGGVPLTIHTSDGNVTVAAL